MRAVTQERRQPAAQPPSHPSGQTIDGGGTWNEGRPLFTPQAPPDKRGSPVPTISIKSEGGEIPVSPVSLPDKRGGSGPPAALLGPGAKGAEAGAAGGEGGPHDPCAKPSEKHPDGSRQERKAEPPPGSQHEVVCRRGEVHSKARGRDETREVPSAAAPDGAFSAHTGEPAKPPPQGPAGGFADAPEKSAGYGTARIDLGSCAPQDPSITVKMPPSHPAMGAAPRRRPTPSVPAFGARAALTAPKDDDVGTKAPRGLGVSQVHLSGPMLYPGPRLPRTDSLAEAPPGSLADESAPAGQRQAAAPSGTAGAGQAKGMEAGGLVTPTAAQTAASARGGGGGGGLTAAQQHATNAIRMDDLKGGLHAIEVGLPTYEKRANDAREKLKPLEQAHREYQEAVLSKEAALQAFKKVFAEVSDPTDPRQIKAQGDLDKANVAMNEAAARQAGYGEAKIDADEKQRKLDKAKGERAGVEREQQTLNAKNRKLEDGMSPTEKARAEKEKERLKRDQDRLAAIERKLERARQDRETRNSKRPDYRATQRAKARRAGNKSDKSLAKAKKLLGIATSQNKNLSAKARKSALAKAKKQVQKAKQAAVDKLAALDKAGASAAEIKEAQDELKKVEEVEKKIEEAEEDLEEEEQEPPPPDPCLLPCDCNIPCESPDRCICSRRPTGGEPVTDGGGGGAGEPTPPDVLVPDGSTVAEEENGDGEDKNKDKEKKPSGNGKGGGGGAVGPQGGAPQLPEGAYFQAAGEEDEEQEEEKPKAPKAPDGGTSGTDDKPKETKTADELDEERKEARRKFIEDLKKALIAAAKDLAANLPGWPSKGYLATAPDPEAWKEKNTDEELLWTQTGTGIVVEGDPAAGIEQLLKHRRDFGLDCSSGGWLAWYKGMLDVLGKEKFNSLFATTRTKNGEKVSVSVLVINGAWSSGSGIENERPAYTNLKLDGPSQVLVDTDLAPGSASQAGDQQYLAQDVGQTAGGQNVMVVEDVPDHKVYNSTTKVYGHGSPDHGYPAGIHPSSKFEEKYGDKYGLTARLNTNHLLKVSGR